MPFGFPAHPARRNTSLLPVHPGHSQPTQQFLGQLPGRHPVQNSRCVALPARLLRRGVAPGRRDQKTRPHPAQHPLRRDLSGLQQSEQPTGRNPPASTCDDYIRRRDAEKIRQLGIFAQTGNCPDSGQLGGERISAVLVHNSSKATSQLATAMWTFAKYDLNGEIAN